MCVGMHNWSALALSICLPPPHLNLFVVGISIPILFLHVVSLADSDRVLSLLFYPLSKRERESFLSVLTFFTKFPKHQPVKMT